MYADYFFYFTEWSGKVPQEDYNFFARQAVNHMDYVTFDRLTELKEDEITDRIRMCQCELVDFLFRMAEVYHDEGHGILSSEAVDTFKRTFVLPKELNPDARNENILNICQRYLTRPTNFMYVGV